MSMPICSAKGGPSSSNVTSLGICTQPKVVRDGTTRPMALIAHKTPNVVRLRRLWAQQQPPDQIMFKINCLKLFKCVHNALPSRFRMVPECDKERSNSPAEIAIHNWHNWLTWQPGTDLVSPTLPIPQLRLPHLTLWCWSSPWHRSTAKMDKVWEFATSKRNTKNTVSHNYHIVSLYQIASVFPICITPVRMPMKVWTPIPVTACRLPGFLAENSI